jgi:ribonuclease HI
VLVTITTDGSSPKNPGQTRIGAVLQDSEGHVLALISESSGRGTNNTAEYSAIIRGLSAALSLGATHATVYSDSQLCVKQITGEYKVRNEKLRVFVNQVKALVQDFTRVRFRWQRRSEGLQPDADKLAAGGDEAEAVFAKYMDQLPR